ncbi:MAG: hypothetical protein H6R04_573 [Burkholderiaceae bacterium]|nr:hypothetical protein [Burkholderiaceae bacterium]
MSICETSDKKPCRISRCIGKAALIVVGVAALGGVVMLLWNWLMPSLFAGVQQVNYCQALGLLLLCKILFGCFRCCGCRGRERRSHDDSMTDEQREQLKQRLASRWGCCAPKSEGAAEAPKQAEQSPDKP